MQDPATYEKPSCLEKVQRQLSAQHLLIRMDRPEQHAMANSATHDREIEMSLTN